MFPSACSLAISEDFNWLLLRLNPYRVANFGFGLAIEWRAPDGSPNITKFFPTQTFVRFTFDHVIPPVLITSFTAVLDPYGGEQLLVPVENVLSPPHASPLLREDFFLRLQVTAERQIVTLLTPQSIHSVTGSPLRRILTFRTEALRAPPQSVSIAVLAGKTHKMSAVVHPGGIVNLTLASNRLAILDSCSQNVTVYNNGFLLIQLGIPYNQTTFSGFKNSQVKLYIRRFFPRLPNDALKLVHIEQGLISFAMLLADSVENSTFAMQIRELSDSVSNESFAKAIHVSPEYVESYDIQVVETTLCEAFPHLLSNGEQNAKFNGIQVRLLLLRVVAVISACFVTIMMVARILLNKRKRRENKEIITTESYPSDSFEGKGETTEPLAASSPYPYPSEARAEFARRYEVNSTVTPEKVRDSDLASTIAPEGERSIAGLLNFARQLGRDIEKGLGHNWSRIRSLASSGRRTHSQTVSGSANPPIYIEHHYSNSAPAETR